MSDPDSDSDLPGRAVVPARTAAAVSGTGGSRPQGRFSARVTLLCLVGWAVISGLTTAGNLLLDPVDSFEHPLEVAVAAVERPAELAAAASELLPRGFPGAAEVEPDRPAYDPLIARLEAAELESAATELEARRAISALESGSLPSAVRLPPRGDIAPALWVALQRAYPGLEERTEGRPSETSGEERPANDGPTLGAESSDAFDDEALVAAALELHPGWARSRLLERLSASLGDPTAIERAEATVAEDAARTRRRFETYGPTLAVLVPAALLGGLLFLASLFLPRQVKRLDPATRPNLWPTLPDGVGLVARYGLGLVLLQTAIAVVFGAFDAPPPIGLLGLVSSLPLAILVLTRWRGDDRARELGFGLQPSRVPLLVPAALAGWAACWGAAILFTILFTGTDSDPFANPFFDVITNSDASLRWRLLLEACVWAPLFEELGFRAALFGGLRRRLPFLPAALASGLAFGLVHSYDLAGMSAIAVVGVVLAFVYERTRSILACVATHALFNLGQLQFSYLFFA